MPGPRPWPRWLPTNNQGLPGAEPLTQLAGSGRPGWGAVAALGGLQGGSRLPPALPLAAEQCCPSPLLSPPLPGLSPRHRWAPRGWSWKCLLTKIKREKSPPGLGAAALLCPPALGAMPGPCQDQAGTSRGGEGCGGAPALPSPPGRCEAIPPPISWVVLGFVSLGKSQTSKAAAGSGGSTAPPRAGAGGWGLAPPQLCVELLQPRGGGSEGLAGTGPQLPPPPQNPPGTWSRAGTTGGGRLLHFSPPLSSPLLPPPPFFFPPSPPCLPCTCLGFLCVFHSVRHGSINQKPLPAPCPLSPAPSRCPSRRSPHAPRH
nr:basic proline-rich protein-like [Anas platyrhynchos]